jgi:hypothetical protein
MAYLRYQPQGFFADQAGVSFLEEPAAPPPAGPVFRLECGAGCHPVAAAQCRATLRRAIVAAIRLASNAAAKLEASPRDADTVRHFRFLFGHDPSRPVPWAANRESGAIVARRFRMVEQALRRRGTQFRCGCPGAAATVNARTIPPNEIRLCDRFWTLSPILRAGVVLHEMLHLLFHTFLRHDARERRRNNAHCYEAFALRVAGHTPEQSDISRCRSRPA